MADFRQIMKEIQGNPRLSEYAREKVNADPRMQGLAAGADASTMAEVILREIHGDYQDAKAEYGGGNSVTRGTKRHLDDDGEVGFFESIRGGYGWRESPEGLLLGAARGDGLPDHWTDGTEFTFMGNLAREIQGLAVPSSAIGFGLGGKAAGWATRAVGKKVAAGVMKEAANEAFESTLTKAIGRGVSEKRARAWATQSARQAAEAVFYDSDKLLTRLASRGAKGAGELAAFSAIHEGARQVAAESFEPTQILLAVGRGGATGALAIGAAGALFNKSAFPRYVVESLAFGAVGPALEGHKPTADDFAGSFALLGVLHGTRHLPRATREAMSRWGNWRNSEEAKLAQEGLKKAKSDASGKGESFTEMVSRQMEEFDAEALNQLEVARKTAHPDPVEPGGRTKAGQERYKKEAVERATVLGVNDALAALKDNPTTREWYRALAQQARDLSAREIPELKDPHVASYWKALLSITSQGNKIRPNYEATQSLMKEAIEGKFQLELNHNGRLAYMEDKLGIKLEIGGASVNAVAGNALKLNRLVERHGVKGAMDWLLEKHSGKEIKDEMGLNDYPGYTGKNGVYYGAIGLGPKIGTYFMQLNGIHHDAVYDRWLSRTWNRWMGTPTVRRKNRKTGEMEDVLPDGYRSVGELKVAQEAIREIGKQLKEKTGQDWDADQVQALLWYHEKNLFESHGAGGGEAISYLEPAQARYRRIHGEEPPASPQDPAGSSEPTGERAARERVAEHSQRSAGEPPRPEAGSATENVRERSPQRRDDLPDYIPAEELGTIWHYTVDPDGIAVDGIRRRHAGRGAAGDEKRGWKQLPDGSIDPSTQQVHFYLPGAKPEAVVTTAGTTLVPVNAKGLRLADMKSEHMQKIAQLVQEESGIMMGGPDGANALRAKLKELGYDGWVDPNRKIGQLFRDVEAERVGYPVPEGMGLNERGTLHQKAPSIEPAKGTTWKMEKEFQDAVNALPPEFHENLMEFVHRMGATLRSKPDLPQGTYGQYLAAVARDKIVAHRIETHDLRDPMTNAHETGHALHYTLFSPKGAGRALREQLRSEAPQAELDALTKRVRPWERGKNKTYDMYRDDPRELMANFFSVYLTSPELAKKHAPVTVQIVEDVLRNPNNKEAASLVRELRELDVVPAAPKRKPSANLPPIKDAPPVTKEPAANEAVKEITKGRARAYHARVAEADNFARILYNLFPKKERERILEDIGAFEEGIHNLRTGDSAAVVKKRLESLGEPARDAIRKYRFFRELMRDEVNKYLLGATKEEYIKFLDDYLPHFYMNAKKILKSPGFGQFVTNAISKNERRLPDLAEAERMGLKPYSQDAAQLLKMWSHVNWRVATNIGFLDNLSKIRTSDGKPVMVPMSEAPPGWRVVEHQMLRRLKKFRAGAAVHPDVYRTLMQTLEGRSNHAVTRALEGFNAWAKKSMLSFSLFHHIALTESMLAVQGLGGFLKGVKWDPEAKKWTSATKLSMPSREGYKLMMDPEYVKIPLEAGLQLGRTDDYSISRVNQGLMKMEAATRNVPGLGWLTRQARKSNDAWDRNLWDHYHSGLKAHSFFALEEEWGKKNPNANAAEVKKARETMASYLNDAFGGLEWETMANMSPKVRQVMQLGMLAPDWTLANLRIFGRTFTMAKDPLRRKLQLRYWRNMIATLAISSTGIQYGIFKAFGDEAQGDQPWFWDNEKGKQYDIDLTPIMRAMGLADGKRRYYTHFGKQAREVFSYFTRPDALFRGKASPIFREAWEQITGAEGAGFLTPYGKIQSEGGSVWQGVPHRALSISSNFVPFAFRGNQFALAAPMSRGASPYKMRVAYAKAMQKWAEDDGGLTPALEVLGRDITRAGLANGVDVKKVFGQAAGEARSKYYQEFFEAFRKGDQGKMNAAARKVIRLHGGINNLMSSIESRASAEGRPLTEGQKQAITGSYNRAASTFGPSQRNRQILSEIAR